MTSPGADEAKENFKQLWRARTDEALPAGWERDVGPLLAAPGMSMGLIAETMDIATSRPLDPGRAARANPRWRYFLGVLRNKADAMSGAPSQPPPQPSSNQINTAIATLTRIGDALERIAVALERNHP